MLKISKNWELTAYQLKMIALISMLLDHVARIFLPHLYILKMVGRLAFVLYSFLLVEGFVHSKNLKRYFIRLLVFAVLSEIPFDLAFYGTWLEASHQNVFFSLTAGLLSLFVVSSKKLASDLKVLYVVGLVTLCNILRFDYYYLGVFQVLCFYAYRSSVVKKFLTVGILNVFYMFRISIQSVAVVGFLPIYVYNGKEGKKTGLLYYTYYPLHLLIYWVIRRFLI